MKLDCKMEASGIDEIVLFRQLQFNARYILTGGRCWEKFVTRGRCWEKFVFLDNGELLATDTFLSDEQMMKKVKELSGRKDIHVWVSYSTLNIDWRK